VIERCIALVVAIAPLQGKISEKIMDEDEDSEYLKSKEYSEAQKILAFCRLWCIGE
jgi:hypothetical protein